VSWATWQRKEKAALLEKGVATFKYKLGACNPINFTILNPEELRWKIGHKVGMYINGWGTDPGTILYLKRVMVPLKASSHHGFHSFYEETEGIPLPISASTRNLLLALPHEPYNGAGFPHLVTGVWLLETSLIGRNYLAQWGE
jgi:hypothetical protein